MADEFERIFGNWLGEQSEAKIPEGGGGFSNTGFVGPLMASKMFQFWSREDLKVYIEDANLPYKEGVDYHVRGKEDSHFYYFVNPDAAKICADLVQAFPPRMLWHFEMPTSAIINFQSADAADKFGKAISSDARIVGTGSKYRHEYHMLALPSLVDALARKAGYIDAPIWHCTELLEAQDSDYTDEFQYRMIGHPDAKANDVTSFVWPESVARSRRSWQSQIRIVRSTPAVASVWPSGEKVTELTGPE